MSHAASRSGARSARRRRSTSVGSERDTVVEGRDLLEGWAEARGQRLAAEHPLEEPPPVVLVGAVEPTPWDQREETPEDPLVADVHLDDEDRARAVRAERALADQEPSDEAPAELRLLVNAWEDRTAPGSA